MHTLLPTTTIQSACFRRTFVPEFALSKMTIPVSNSAETHKNQIVTEKRFLS